MTEPMSKSKFIQLLFAQHQSDPAADAGAADADCGDGG